MLLAPPAYVTGISHHSARHLISSKSIPDCLPSTWVACTSSSSQCCSISLITSLLNTRSVMVCHLFIATRYSLFINLQLRSTTILSFPMRLAIFTSLFSSNTPFSNKYEVTITCVAPLLIQPMQLSMSIPPPTCIGCTLIASIHDFSLLGPSIMQCPPVSLYLRYSSA
eukprot:NODE_82_length_22708_cov_0.383476.p11 type:complete len:168 gc:universal NODE_82_length_22708_cov_0.383476:3983-3480(-)